MGVQVSTFVADKAAGKASIVTVEGVPFYSRKAFDKETGALKPELSQLDRAALVAEMARLQGDIDQLTQMIADIDEA